ncbi:TPA: hypothetical protein PPN70_004039 [Serratia rubidaea]|nr:hypothetical protein [Serratia rubidaea]HDJ1447177.1 hypothetical protein [Serratia rubidaea]HDJ1463981.1 hypothetical protein [Serratia rubidaea]HDJ2773038.1 hypothetical protein [Serratia rubidaea]
MTYLFSKSTKLFYPKAFLDEYIENGMYVGDGVEVDEKTFKEFSCSNIPEGKAVGVGDNGMPTLVESDVKLDIVDDDSLGR